MSNIIRLLAVCFLLLCSSCSSVKSIHTVTTKDSTHVESTNLSQLVRQVSSDVSNLYGSYSIVIYDTSMPVDQETGQRPVAATIQGEYHVVDSLHTESGEVLQISIMSADSLHYHDSIMIDEAHGSAAKKESNKLLYVLLGCVLAIFTTILFVYLFVKMYRKMEHD